MTGAFHPYKQGYLFIALVVIYALTSAVAGYTSAYFYVQLEGTEWVCSDVKSLLQYLNLMHVIA
jgi:hypothetical protein